MDRCLHLTSTLPRSDRPSEAEHDVSFSPALVEAFLAEYTAPGGLVLDPFAGYGTTLVVAEAMGRRSLGCELLADRVEFIRSRLGPLGAIHRQDARNLSAVCPSGVDFVLTSPPYMTRTHHPQNPLTAYQTLDGDYQTYLDELQSVFAQVAALMGPSGRVVVNVANLQTPGAGFTPLAWDIGRALEEVLELDKEIIICWDVDQPGITQDYCLVFRPAAQADQNP